MTERTDAPPQRMKERERGFLTPANMPEDVFDYIRELHDYFWRVVQAVNGPGCSGDLQDYIPGTVAKLEKQRSETAPILGQSVGEAYASAMNTARDAALEEAAQHLDALVDSLSAPISYSHAAQSIRALKNAAPQELGPCSCQDSGKCRYIDGSPACMQESAATPNRDAVDAARYRWLNKHHNFVMHVEDNDFKRQHMNLRCGEPLDTWIDARIEEERQCERGERS